MSSRRRLRYLAFAAPVLLGSCATESGSEPPANPVDVDPSIAREVAPAVSVPDPDELDPSVLDDLELNPEGIINAAVLLHGDGDVDAALDSGVFTRGELDAARAGLADGSLSYLFE